MERLLIVYRGRGRFKPSYLLFMLPVISCLALGPAPHPAEASFPDRHQLQVQLRLEERSIAVACDIILSSRPDDHLSVHIAPRARVRSAWVAGAAAPFTFEAGELLIPLPPSRGADPVTVRFSYEAVFDDPLPNDPLSTDNPGFGVTGTIGPQGAFLLPGCGWYPRIAGRPASVLLEVAAPRGIYAVTAGRLIGHQERGDQSLSTWEIEPVVEGVALSAGPYVVESRNTGKVPVYTYLFPESAHLSARYLEAAAWHLDFHEALHGPYAFPKFAIVENFFPTGYGFPSYTLLGTTVLRLPFIPDTSLKHEVAHNWWGNGVLVARESGNWAEGLTTYVADYLREERSSAEEGLRYRRQILQEYAALAASNEDFPLSRFLGRTSPATRAVGYGKSAFVFHMIRQRIGDDRFWRSLQRLYRERLFQETSWEDLRQVFTETGAWSPAESRRFFDQWVQQAGAPRLELREVRRRQVDGGWTAEGVLAQPGSSYDLRFPLQLETDGGVEKQVIFIHGGSAAFSFRSPHRPERLVGDPEAHVLRHLAPEEVPPSVNSVKGSRSLVAVLASSAGAGVEQTFQAFLESLGQGSAPMSREDRLKPSDVEGRDVVLFGRPRPETLQWLLPSRPNGIQLSGDGFSYEGQEAEGSGDCLFGVFKDPLRKGSLTALFYPLEDTSAESVTAAVRKITHYGKYSVLTFADGANCGKAIWPVTESPLIFTFKDAP
ncbi:MAG: hypothetical protein MUF52_00980 [Syntrophobacteraceae bacterium]|nr:hypothetical protein [Syntrophobacteraceae bacterium]